LFERYEEKARRVIFFARYEASLLGNPYLEAEHLLLGLFREDKALTATIAPAHEIYDAFQREVQERTPEREKIATSVDLPLSQDAKRVLAIASEESEALGHKTIATGHLLLGLLRVPGLAADFLRKHGVELNALRGKVREAVLEHNTPRPITHPTQRVHALEEAEPPQPAAPELAQVIPEILRQIALTVRNISLGDDYARQHLKRKPWTRKEAMGHLVDLATTYHQWLARALTEPKLTAAAYPADEWVSAQKYSECPWQELVDLWVSLSRLMVHVLAVIPPEKMKTPCRIGIEEPITLWELIQRYITETTDLIGQILAKL
jgi:hypothetical protein